MNRHPLQMPDLAVDHRWLARWSLIGAVLAAGMAPTAAVAAVTVVVPPMPSRAEPTDRDRSIAQNAYEETDRLFRAGNIEGAKRAAAKVFEHLPNASTALLRAQIFEEAGARCDAFEALLLAADLDPTGDERNEIRAGLARHGRACRTGMGWVRVEVTPNDAVARIDDQPVPLRRTVGLPSGSYRLELEALGHAGLRTILAMEGGRESVARYELEQVEAPVAAPAPSPPPAATAARPSSGGSDGRAIAGWSLLGGGVAMIGAGVGLNMWALSAQDELDRLSAPVDGMTDAEREAAFKSAESDRNTRALTAYVLYGLGGGAAVTGAVLLLTGGDDEVAGFRVGATGPLGSPGLTLGRRF